MAGYNESELAEARDREMIQLKRRSGNPRLAEVFDEMGGVLAKLEDTWGNMAERLEQNVLGPDMRTEAESYDGGGPQPDRSKMANYAIGFTERMRRLEQHIAATLDRTEL